MHTTIDLTAPFDPTGMPSLSGVQLLQLISGLVPHWDKGMIIYTADNGAGVPDVPDAAVTTIWKRFIWIREGATTVTPYVWNDAASVHNDGAGNPLSKWYSLTSSIGTGTITGAMIANNTILDASLTTVDAARLFGSIINPVLSNLLIDLIATGTDVKGALTALIIQPNAVTSAKVQSVNHTSNITAAGTGLSAVDTIRPSTTALTVLRTNTARNSVEWQVVKITEMANPAGAGDANKTVVVDAGGNNFVLSAAPITTGFTSTSVALKALNSAGLLINNEAHGLKLLGADAAPTRLRCVLIRQNVVTADGYTYLDEVDPVNFFCYTTIGAVYDVVEPLIAFGANKTVVWATQNKINAGVESIYVKHKSTGVAVDISASTVTDWSIKIYASL